MKDIRAIIKKMDFFADLDDKALSEISSRFTIENYLAGETIFEEFAAGDSFYIIISGEVEINKHIGKTVESTQAQLDILKAHSYFGEMALVDDFPRSATVRAHTNATLLKMTKNVFIDLCMHYPMLLFNLMKTISHRLRSTNQKFVEIVDRMIKESRMAAIGTAASKIVHDIKTPITVMILTAELISTMYEETGEFTKKIISQAKELDAMIREILDFAKGEQSSLTLKEVNIDKFFDDLMNIMDAIAVSREINLTYINKVKQTVVFDESRIKRCLSNLIKNALEAIDEGESVHVLAVIENNYLKISVQDTGDGIPEDLIDSLFEPFITKGKKGGTGLGLAISKKIIEDHKGKLTVSNTPNSGACFTMYIPLIKDS
ncbi:MAG: ATP-binding protein [Candidatus Cloacimonadales bacterium]|jgi:signal transduction histidine kinase|nr:cyclic nucleotide-binding domain-containing protein [Candidatus Cloacimonadota bacterium]MDD2649970.1 ATP-binding protein [Candidatus Cloacimonadota bacterium]MDD3501560.1 ATP-binding protein [Candidatus Cloacimonadota bacterium]MDX9976510.1 ATP-binding protein [Candidatus Cloacimonadales bacterium]